MPTVLIQKGSYQSVGRCIYCRSTEKPLGDEHIIPSSLGGQLILKDASCRKCEKITSYIEGVCARQWFGDFRTRMAMPTRRPKERPTELPIEIIREDGTYQTIKIPVPDYPRILTLLRIPPPEALTGELSTIFPMIWYSYNPKDIAKVGRILNLGRFVTTHKLNIPIFFRMLAKIAHAYAVAEIGLDRISSLDLKLPDLIRSDSKNVPPLIGGDMKLSEPTKYLNEIWLWSGLRNHREYLVVSIRLFASMGAPMYHVVVGDRDATQSPLAPSRDL